MRRILTYLLVLISIACANDKILRIVWDQYDTYEEAINVAYFKVYKWYGPSDTLFNKGSLLFIDSVLQVPLADSLELRTDYPMEMWILAACVAYDGLGRNSDTTYSRLYAPPERPGTITIKK